MSRIVKQGTGSDTRMYSPRSESEEFMYADDEEVYAPGDPDQRELESQKKKESREEQQRKWTGLQHLKISTKKDHEEEPFEESTPLAEQNEISENTGPAGSMGENLDQAVGARTGTGSAMGEIPPQLPTMGAFGLTRSEAMEQAWDGLLLKVLGDPVGTETLESVDRKMRSGIGPGGVKGRKAHRVTAFPRPIGGRSPWASTKRRASVHQRLFGNIKGQGGKSLRSNSKTGMMRQRYTLSPHHLGVGSLVGKPRPGRLENPGKYISWLGRQSAYRGAGGAGVMLPYTPHAPREQLGQLRYPGQAGSGRMRLMPGQAQAMRQGPSRALRGPPKPRAPRMPRIAKAELEELVEVSKAYVRHLGPGLTSIDTHEFKDLLRELKHLLSRLPRKSLMGISGGGSNNDGMVEAPSNGPQKTSRNEGATESDPEDDPRYWGADAAGMYSRRGGSNV